MHGSIHRQKPPAPRASRGFVVRSVGGRAPVSRVCVTGRGWVNNRETPLVSPNLPPSFPNNRRGGHLGRISWLVTRRLAPHGPTRWPAHHCEVASQGQAAALCSHLSACELGKEGAAGWGPQGQEARGGAVHPAPRLQGSGHQGKTEQCPCVEYGARARHCVVSLLDSSRFLARKT